jgi:hypothetical protein
VVVSIIFVVSLGAIAIAVFQWRKRRGAVKAAVATVG